MTIPAELPVEVPIVVPVYDFTGPYVGAHAGLRLMRYELGDSIVGGSIGETADTDAGLVVGLQAGYNWHVDPRFLVGIEGDISYGRNRTNTRSNAASGIEIGPIVNNNGLFTQTVTEFASAQSYWGELDWTGSLRARLGLVADRTLFYVTGGLALARLGINVQNDASTTTTIYRVDPGNPQLLPANIQEGPTTVETSASTTTRRWRAGWTVGAGIEHAFRPNWLLRAEYLYANYGSVRVALSPTHSAHFRPETHVARLALSYRY